MGKLKLSSTVCLLSLKGRKVPIRQNYLRCEGAAVAPLLAACCLLSTIFQIYTPVQVIIRHPGQDRPASGVLRL